MGGLTGTGHATFGCLRRQNIAGGGGDGPLYHTSQSRVKHMDIDNGQGHIMVIVSLSLCLALTTGVLSELGLAFIALVSECLHT